MLLKHLSLEGNLKGFFYVAIEYRVLRKADMQVSLQ